MASQSTTKGSGPAKGTSSAKTPLKDSLTPRKRLQKKLNAMPPSERKAALKQALAIWSQNRQKRSSKSAANG